MAKELRKLNLSEVKKLQIKMLENIDQFCRSNNLTYYLSYGTLLGAIRHKGYIPWDDDIDIMVPREELDRLICEYQDEDYEIIDISNNENYDFPYPRMVAKSTFQLIGKNKLYGVFLDIYPVDNYPETKKEQDEYKRKLKKIKNKRWFWIRVRNRMMKLIKFNRLSMVYKYTKLHKQTLASTSKLKTAYVHVFSPYTMPMKKEIFINKTEVEFEGKKYFAPIGWDAFLTNYYGNYMKLPPEEKRHPYHGTESYFIEK